MANKEFRNIEEFIEGFTRKGPTPVNFVYDGTIWGMDFKYNSKIYRITRDTIGMKTQICEKFNKTNDAFIQFFEIPVQQYPNEDVNDLDLYLGIFNNVDDLLDNGKIDGIPLRYIIASENTEILAID